MIKSYPSVLLFKITLYPKSLWSSVVGFTMPISADQWRSVVGSNNARRPRQIGLKCFLITNQPLTCITPCRMYAERKQPSATDSGYLSHKSIVYVNYLALLLCLIMSVFHNTILNSGSSTQNFFLGVGVYHKTVVADGVDVDVTVSLSVLSLQLFLLVVALSLLLLAGDVERNPGPGNLTVDDLRNVNRAVSDIKARWYLLGVELGIHPSTLDSIKCKCFHDPENCLLQVLTEWLKTEEPTWKRLVEVLKGNTLKEFKVAQKIEEEYCRKLGGNQDPSHKMCKTTPYCSTDDGCVTKFAVNLKHKYLEQELPTEGSFKHTNEVCRLAMIRKEKLGRFDLDDEFIQQTITGKVDDILQKKTPVNIQDIFKGVPNDRKIVLIEGAPGAGKSSLSLNICKKWSTGEFFQEFRLVVLVRLRDPCIHDASSVAGLLPHCEETVSKEVGEAIINSNGEGILLIFDGWDEFPDNFKNDKDCFIKNLIKGHQNHDSHIIVTSRPSSSFDLHTHVSKRIEILGFTANELRQYIQFRLSKKESVDALLEKIEEHPEVQSSCYLPLHARFIVDAFIAKQNLPSTQYGIFETVVTQCIARYQSIHKQEAIDSLENLTGEVRDHFLSICELAYVGILENKIIFTDAELSKCTNFQALDLLQEVQSMLPLKGQLSKTYNFLHLSVQEFLAAQHLALKPTHEQYWLFRGLMEDERCLLMLTFFAAKTGLSAPKIADFVSNVWQHYTRGEFSKRHQIGSKVEFAFKCICETLQPSFCKPLIVALNGKFNHLLNTPYIHADYYTLGSFLSLSTQADIGCCIDVGSIIRSSIRDQDWNLFIKGLLRFYKEKPIKSPLKLCLYDLTSTDLLLKILMETELIHTVELTVFEKSVTRHMVELTMFEKSVTRQHIVSRRHSVSMPLSLNVDTHDEANFSTRMKELLSSNNTYPKSFTIRGKFFSQAHQFKQISYSIQLNTFLLELHLVHCNISTLEVEMLCQALLINRSLKLLDLSQNSISGGVKCITEVIKVNSVLANLCLCNCEINIQNMTSLLKAAVTMKKISLSGNHIGDEGARKIAATLEGNSSLEELNFVDCGITSNGSVPLLRTYQKGLLRILIVSKSSYYPWRASSQISSYELDTFLHMEQLSDQRNMPFKIPVESILKIPVDCEATELLANILSEQNHVEQIEVDAQKLDHVSFSRLFNSLKANSSLKVFQVKHGKMNIANLKELGEVLKENKYLESLIIDSSIEASLKAPQVDLVSDSNMVHSTRILKRCKSEPDQCQIYEGSDSNSQSLEDVPVSALTHFAECLSMNNSLKVLRLPSQCNPEKLKRAINEAFHHVSPKIKLLPSVYSRSRFDDIWYFRSNFKAYV